MRHAMLGAGGIGGLLAAALARTGAEVTLLLRRRRSITCGDGVAAGGGVHEAVVVGGSVQVGDVLLGDDEGELGMHG